MKYAEEPTSSFARGMQDSAAATAYRRDEAALILNGRVSPEGTVSTRLGSKRAHSAALNSGAQGWGGTVFITTAGVVQWLAFVGDKAYLSLNEGSTWAAIVGATGLRTDYWSFAVMTVGADNTLYCANGGTNVYAWDGVTWGVATGFPAGVKVMAVANERMAIGGHDGSNVWLSEVRVAANYVTGSGGAVIVNIVTDDGDSDITGLFQLGPHLLVFKRHSVNTIDGFGATDIEVQAGAIGVSRSVGCLAFRTIAAVGDTSVMWLSERGIERYSLENGLRLVSQSIRGFLAEVGWGNILAAPGLPCAIYLPEENEYRCAVPTYLAKNDTVIRVGLLTGAISLDRYAPAAGSGTVYVDEGGYLQFEPTPTRQQARVIDGVIRPVEGGVAGAYVGLDGSGNLELLSNLADHAVLFVADRGAEVNTPIAIGYDGFVRWLDEGTVDDVASDGTGGVPIGFRLQTRPLLFGDPYRRKRPRLLWISVDAPSGATVDANLLADGVPRATHSLSIGASQNRQPRIGKARVGGRGTTLQVELRTSDQASLAGVTLAAEPLREVGV